MINMNIMNNNMNNITNTINNSINNILFIPMNNRRNLSQLRIMTSR